MRRWDQDMPKRVFRGTVAEIDDLLWSSESELGTAAPGSPNISVGEPGSSLQWDSGRSGSGKV
jgi:hypothetical protein